MSVGSRATWSALALGALAIAVMLAIRPLVPPDETRYVRVAQEMRDRGDFLVPHLNGAPYPDKPPLLFWLINSAWSVAGDHEWVARAIPPAAGLGALVLMALLARRLWPDRASVGGVAALVLGGAFAWALYASLVMFDTLLACCVLVAILGGVESALGRRRLGWSLMALGLGAGVLAKGPIVFLHALPTLLLAPWWWPGREPFRAGRWYGGLLAAVGAGALIALAWALPAAHAGGPEYASNVLWNQTANRMMQAFAHARPPWWYLPILPLVFLPWSLWPATWRAVSRLRPNGDWGVRLCLAWVGGGFVALSLVSGKQVHYLVPMLAGVGLLLARGLDEVDVSRRWDAVPVVLGVAALGAALWLARTLVVRLDLDGDVARAIVHARPLELMAPAVLAALVLLPASRGRMARVAQVAVVGLLMVVLLQASITGWGTAFDGPWPPWTRPSAVAGDSLAP